MLRELLTHLDDFERVVGGMALRLLNYCAEFNAQISTLEKKMLVSVRALAPRLLAFPGYGVRSASVIVGETAEVHPLRTNDAFDQFTSTAWVPVSSGSSQGKGHLHRDGNRSMNCNFT